MTNTELQAMMADPALFRAKLLVPTDAGPRLLGDIVDDWQDQDFRALDKSWLAVVGQGEPEHKTAWLERPRGHSKSSDLAVSCIWALFAGRDARRGVWAAADADQARIGRDLMAGIVQVNPWLHKIIDVQRDAVRNRVTEAELRIITSDVATSFGLLVDWVVADEVCQWREPGLWHSLLTTAAKKQHCLLLAITNSGLQESWQWEVREKLREDPACYFRRLDGPVASWISAETIARQERLLPPLVARRYWHNEWVPGSGDALDPADIEAAITRRGPVYLRDHAKVYIGCLDLATKHDRAAFLVLDCDMSTHRVGVANVEQWIPPDGGTIDLIRIRLAIEMALDRFKINVISYDPWQSTLLSQELEQRGVTMDEMPFGQNNLIRMARDLTTVFRARKIDLYGEPQLISDLKKLCMVQKPYGLRLEAPRDRGGHCDAAVALSIGLPLALEIANREPEVFFERIGGRIGGD